MMGFSLLLLRDELRLAALTGALATRAGAGRGRLVGLGDAGTAALACVATLATAGVSLGRGRVAVQGRADLAVTGTGLGAHVGDDDHPVLVDVDDDGVLVGLGVTTDTTGHISLSLRV